MEKEIEQLSMVYTKINEFLVAYSFQILGAIIVLLVGLFIAKKLSNLVLNLCLKHNIDITLSHFIANATRILLIVMVAIICLGKLGISITPMVAAIGAVSLGAGLALQGLLSNYGAGLTIIVMRTFVVGDTISVQGVTGVVKEIRLAYTLLSDEDNVDILIPNKHIVGEIIHNSHAEKLAEEVVGIAYQCDPEEAIAVIAKALASIDGLNHARGPLIGIAQFGESSIDIGVRYWIPTERYFELRYQTNLAIFRALEQAKIVIPFPQRDVHLIQAANA